MLDDAKEGSGVGIMSAWRERIEAGTILMDPAQQRAVEQLQELWTRLHGYDPQPRSSSDGWLGRLLHKKRVDDMPADYPNGLYLVGEVGRGKSMLMDMFFAAAEVPRKRRVHFHEFTQECHQRLHRINQGGAEDAIAVLAASVAAEASLLCFDEFQIHDIGDAMLLGRLFEGLFARAVVIVATSNTLPDNLYSRSRPGYESFRPFIALLKRHLDVLVLDGGQDYRRKLVHGAMNWHVPADGAADRALDDVFARLTGGAAPRQAILTVFGRKLAVPYAANGVARFDFPALCAQALGAGDYLALATHYDTMLIDAIPLLSPDNFDEARRFITLIDALYEHRVKLYASAAAEPADLYTSGEGAAIFERTVSRLEEMRSEAYFALAHLT